MIRFPRKWLVRTEHCSFIAGLIGTAAEAGLGAGGVAAGIGLGEAAGLGAAGLGAAELGALGGGAEVASAFPVGAAADAALAGGAAPGVGTEAAGALAGAAQPITTTAGALDPALASAAVGPEGFSGVEQGAFAASQTPVTATAGELGGVVSPAQQAASSSLGGVLNTGFGGSAVPGTGGIAAPSAVSDVSGSQLGSILGESQLPAGATPTAGTTPPGIDPAIGNAGNFLPQQPVNAANAMGMPGLEVTSPAMEALPPTAGSGGAATAATPDLTLGSIPTTAAGAGDVASGGSAFAALGDMGGITAAPEQALVEAGTLQGTQSGMLDQLGGVGGYLGSGNADVAATAGAVPGSAVTPVPRVNVPMAGYQASSPATAVPGVTSNAVSPSLPGYAGGVQPVVQPGQITPPGGGGNFLKDLGLTPMSALALATPAAMLAYLASQQKNQTTPPQTQQATQLATNLAGAGQSQIAQAQQGQILPAYQALIDKWQTDRLNEAYQQFARMGRDPNNDTGFLQMKSDIQQQALGMKAQFLNNMITQGLSMTGQASPALLSAGQQQLSVDQQFTQALGQATSSLGQIAALLAPKTVNIGKAA